MAQRAVWLWWFAATSVACGRTMLAGRNDAEASGGDAATGGTNVSNGGTALGGSGVSGGVGGFGGSAIGGRPGAGRAGFGGSGGAGARGAGSGGSAESDDVLGCDDSPVPPPNTPCERFEALGFTGVESPSSVSLVPVRSDGSCVSVVTERTEAGVRELAALTFMPWNHWPTNNPLGPLTKIPLPETPSPRFTAAPSDDGRLALAWQNAAGALAFGWDLDPERFAGSYLRVEGTKSHASATSAIGHLLLTSDMFGLAIRTWARPPSGAYSNHQSTCADGELAADVEPFGNGFLVASSTGEANTLSFGCPNYPDLGGPPTRIMVTKLSAICCSYLVTQWHAEGVITRIRTAPHSNGTWVVWRTDDDGSPVLRRARIAVDNSVPIDIETIGETWAVPGVFDAVIFGSRLAVVWEDSFAGVYQIRVTMIGEDGSVEDFTPQLAVGGPLDDLSVVAGPEGTGLVVGFQNGQLRRLDCRPWF
jgi:hypothetical protein